MGVSITSTNAVYMLTIIPIFPTPVRLTGFMADAAFDTEGADIAEIVLGVDGGVSAGFIPYLVKQTINIMPNSPTSLMFETWAASEKVASEKFFASASIAIPSIGRTYTLANGILSKFVAIANAKKVMEGRSFEITWGDVTGASI